MGKRGARVVLGGLCLALALAGTGPEASVRELTPDQVAEILTALHPDYRLYIGSVRFGATRLRPATLYAGLVRSGGSDPRDPDDRPIARAGAVNDLIIYADTFEPWRSDAWRSLLADHEYFHARHLARGFNIPVVAFGDGRADAHYYEALAWGYVLRRAETGVYGELLDRERAEAMARYVEHRGGIQRFVRRRQPSAWAHYGRFLPEPDLLTRPAASAPTTGPGPEAGPGTR